MSASDIPATTVKSLVSPANDSDQISPAAGEPASTSDQASSAAPPSTLAVVPATAPFDIAMPPTTSAVPSCRTIMTWLPDASAT